MKLKGFIITLLILIMALPSMAVPARRGPHRLVQPDGTSFIAILQGDEFTRIRKTEQGHAIIQDSDGWWCYASFDSQCRRHNTGWRVGSQAPQDVLSASRNIPYDLLAEKARQKRAEASRMQRAAGSLPRLAPFQSEAGIIQEKHGLVILAQFNDVKFRYTKEDFERLLTEEGYNVNGSTGSAKDYFNAQFNGKVNFDFDVSDIVTVSGNRAYYGANDADGNDKNPEELVIEACQLADVNIDFSLYDDDNDGIVDNVFVFYAGEDEAESSSEDCIWAHAWYIYSGAGKNLHLDGCRIDRYACASEISGGNLTFIGTFCHEYSHTFGLPDMYDTDYETDGMSAGLWNTTSLMDGGNYNNKGRTPPYFNAIEREILGISQTILIENDGHFKLNPINESDICYRLNTDNEGEYYLFECRKDSGWDAYIGGNGMLVYHIDKTEVKLERWNFYNNVNTRSTHQCADLVEADSRQDSFTDFNAYATALGKNKGLFFPYGEVNSISPDKNPSLKYWSGKECNISVTGITRNGDMVEFNITGMNGETSPPEVIGLKHEAFDDAVLVNFQSSRPYDGPALLHLKSETGDKLEKSIELIPYESGKYSTTITGLAPARTYTVTIVFKIGEIEGSSTSFSFMTRKKPAVRWPFIYLGTKAEEDGRFKAGTKLPLRVHNASQAEEIRWTFDQKALDNINDGYFTITSSGTLKAYIMWEDGSIDIIMKKIIISE